MSKNLTISLVFILVVVGIGAWVVSRSKAPIGEVPVVVTPEDTKITPTPPAEKPATNLTGFGAVVTLKVGQEVKFTDGLKVVLKKISDSRCKAGVECIWAGELGVVLSLSGGQIKEPLDIYLGPTTQTSTTSSVYTFTYKNSTETSAQFVVTK